MTNQWRAVYLHALQDGWGMYVERFKQFSPQEQGDFLRKQGFIRLGDLLGHVIAWWEESLPVVERWLEEPDYPSPDYDVDEFNSRAVARFSLVDEATVVEIFDARRNDWIKLIENMPEAALSDKKLLDRLNMELIGHLAEHEI